MTSLLVEAVWLNDADACTLEELAEYSGLSHAELAELVTLGAIEPDRGPAAAYVFRSQTIVVARTARRLRDDFELDTQGLAVALNLLQRIQALEARLAAADARLPHPV
ncbi:MAG: merR regulatory family protein [Collimonas fungivorans]|uniref:chaperone modulator CbpM n=1 Tax=Collimonas fungivorans TaxID=158899 RepID=UPI0026F152AB|nr:chaperone modulator CbpM [Collimonas fungivorans]MDB5768196.1 merR regulatory family protein [Collimonas fungivorans]